MCVCVCVCVCVCFCFMSWCIKFCAVVRLMCVFIFQLSLTEWPPIGKIAARSAYEMFSWYKYLIVSLFFPPRFL